LHPYSAWCVHVRDLEKQVSIPGHCFSAGDVAGCLFLQRTIIPILPSHARSRPHAYINLPQWLSACPSGGASPAAYLPARQPPRLPYLPLESFASSAVPTPPSLRSPDPAVASSSGPSSPSLVSVVSATSASSTVAKVSDGRSIRAVSQLGNRTLRGRTWF
jgi:hypothetical protein